MKKKLLFLSLLCCVGTNYSAEENSVPRSKAPAQAGSDSVAISGCASDQMRPGAVVIEWCRKKKCGGPRKLFKKSCAD